MSEVARYKAIIVDADRTIREQADRIEALESCLRQARDALEGFGWHEDSCTIHDLDDEGRHEGCSCGFSNALAAIDAALSGAPVKEDGE